MSLLGTVRANFVDANSKYLVAGQLKEMKDAPQGSWCLIRAFEYPLNHQEKKKAHKSLQAKVPKKKRVPYVPTLLPSNNCGYLIFKDKKPVLFYCSNLDGTMTQDILLHTSEEATRMVY